MKTDDPSSKIAPGPLARGASPEGEQIAEPLVSAAGAAKTANKAINETARKYLAAAGIKADLEDIQNRIRDRPVFYLVIATGAGFVGGGGMASNWGVALLGLDAESPLKRPRTLAVRCCGRRPEAPELPHSRLGHRE